VRRSPITIGVLAAELAVGALVLAPPALADEEPVPVDPDPAEIPAVPVPVEVPTVSVRTGRAGDPNAVTPVASPDVPAGGTTPEEPPAPSAPSAPAPTTPDLPAPSTAPPDAAAAAGVPSSPAPSTPAPPPSAPVPAAHTVVEGDNLWHIAAQHLATVTGRDRATLPVSEIAAYWVRVCDANRATLRSGDLDLIYAGEVVTLPVH
jgi:nucleoid-associated protein YgaU